MVELSTLGSTEIGITSFKTVDQLIELNASFVSKDDYTLVRGTNQEIIFVAPDGATLRVLTTCKFNGVKAALKGGFFSHPDPNAKETLSPLRLKIIKHGIEEKYDQTGLFIYEYDRLIDN